MRNPQPNQVPSDDAAGTLLRVYCATCGVYLGAKPGLGIRGDTHGICRPCFQTALRDLDNLHDFPQPTTEG